MFFFKKCVQQFHQNIVRCSYEHKIPFHEKHIFCYALTPGHKISRARSHAGLLWPCKVGLHIFETSTINEKGLNGSSADSSCLNEADRQNNMRLYIFPHLYTWPPYNLNCRGVAMVPIVLIVWLKRCTLSFWNFACFLFKRNYVDALLQRDNCYVAAMGIHCKRSREDKIMCLLYSRRHC